MTASGASVWRSRFVRYALAAVPLWFTVAVLVFHTPWRIKLIVGGLFAAALLSPAHALLAVAAVAPIGRLLNLALTLRTFRVSEAIVVAFLAGWLLRTRQDGRGPRVPAMLTWLAALAIGGSLVAQAWRIAEYPGALRDTLQLLYQAYYIVPDRIGFDAAARLLEGLGLFTAAVIVSRTQPRAAAGLPAALSVSAAVAACVSLLAARGIGFAPILADYVLSAPRGPAHLNDVNAAGSYFGMMLAVALGIAMRRSPSSVVWVACAIAEAAALWLSGSRTAIAATLIVAGAALAYRLSARWSRSVRRRAFALILMAALAAGLGRAWTLRFDTGADFRRDFYLTSVRMIAARPITGVGIGQYYDASALFLSPFLGWTYGRENAHNFFLQVCGELGVFGAAPLIALFALALCLGARALLASPGNARLLGCQAGIAIMLATCLTGHPLLLDEVSIAFWILLGVSYAAAGAAAAVPQDPQPRRWYERSRVSGWAPAAAVVVVVAVDCAVARRPLAPPDSVAVTGFEPWEQADGTRFRWTHEYASLFVPRNATRVAIPVRMPIDVPQLAPMGVSSRVLRSVRGHLVAGREWATLDVDLPPIDTLQFYRRIDLKVDRTWQPAIYIPASPDMRTVGVQVGEVKPFFE